MKKTTIILFSFALLLIVAGAVLCFAGTRSGDVFDNTVISSTPVSPDIGDNVKSIVVNLDEVTVNVYGNQDCEKSYIQTENVSEKHIKNKSATELNISDKTNFLDVIIDTIQNFAGVRNIFFREQVNTGAKTVNIYLSKNDKVDLTQLTVYADKGTVKIYNMDSTTTYTIEVGKTTDNITLENVSTGSNIHMTVEDGSVSVKDVNAVKLEASISNGNFYLTPINSPEYGYNYDLCTENGTIYINDDDTLSIKEGNQNTYESSLSDKEIAEKHDQLDGKFFITDVIVNSSSGSISIKEQDTLLDQKAE